MYSDAELLDEMLDASAVMRDGCMLTAKALAYRTGKAVQTISDYRRGKLTIPVQFWRQVLNLTRDARILNLLLADNPCDITFNDDLRNIGDEKELLAAAIESLGAFHQQEAYLLEILKDNRIDEADRAQIAKYNAQFPVSRRLQAEVYRAVNTKFAAVQQERNSA
jgi:hypothetical protein